MVNDINVRHSDVRARPSCTFTLCLKLNPKPSFSLLLVSSLTFSPHLSCSLQVFSPLQGCWYSSGLFLPVRQGGAHPACRVAPNPTHIHSEVRAILVGFFARDLLFSQTLLSVFLQQSVLFSWSCSPALSLLERVPHSFHLVFRLSF